MDLQGRAAFVTGGSGDLGAAICERLARAGCDVAVGYLGNKDGADKVAGVVKSLGRKATIVQLDQADATACEPAVNAAVSGLGRLDILVNNAGWNIGIPFPELDKLTVEVWDQLQHTNLRGPFLLAKAAAPHMKKQGAGRIVNIASIAGHRPTGSSIGYATSKAALVHLTRCLAVALAPGITVNCVSPGLIEGTRMAQRIPPAVAESVRKSVVLGRGADVKDIAAQVETFCRADSVTGQVLVVDGGLVFH
jgi:NAD(P)-dependent dehydrogenase (short-subunit alcohol dehydrogenase family)